MTHMFANLVSRVSNNVSVDSNSYQQWKKQYLFDALKNQRYGESFCNHFDIADNILLYESDVDFADRYIQKIYLTNDSGSNSTCHSNTST